MMLPPAFGLQSYHGPANVGSLNVSKVATLVASAEQMCFLMDAIRNPHPAETRVTLNGSELEIGD